MAIKINWKFLKSKKLIISLIVLAIVVVGAWFFLANSQKSKFPYETVKVERGNLTQTVEVTGNINATEDLSLNFQVPGVIAYVGVKEGSKVYAGQWLANLTLTELDAAVAQAQAVLDQKLAGATPEQINAAQKQIESAEIALNNARALANASLNSKYESAIVSLDDVSVKMNNTLKTTRDLKIKYFTDTSQESIRYQNNLDLINNALLKFNGLLNLAKISRNQNDIDTTIDNALESLDIILVSLTSNRDILDIEPHKSKISEQEKASLDNQKSIISTAKITIAGVKNDIAISKSQNENNIKSAEAALNLQKANYDNLVAKPREVDIAYYRAALAQAEANRNKAIIYAPISGVITKVNKNKGETISSTEPMFELLSPHFEINVDVPETNVVKIRVGKNAIITFDALGSDTKFTGKVVSIDPSAVIVRDVVYYKVKITINDTHNELLKPGMTCNILIQTDNRENVLYLPSRSILTRPGTNQKYVRVLDQNNQVVEKDVVIGLKADDGLVEILSGLEENETVILKIL